MTTEISSKEADLKLKRFIAYLIQLDSHEVKDVLHHLPDEFEKIEKETICYHIKQIGKKIYDKIKIIVVVYKI
jgi:hypothetical protein